MSFATCHQIHSNPNVLKRRFRNKMVIISNENQLIYANYAKNNWTNYAYEIKHVCGDYIAIYIYHFISVNVPFVVF